MASKDLSTRIVRWGRWLARRSEAAAFWALALLYLLPVWAFPFLPTQDGPAHLDNAQILRDYGRSSVGYEKFFEVRNEPLPNWTSYLLLAGLMFLLPPLLAEKVLVSLYVLGFAGALRYFLGAFGERCQPLSRVGLLFVYNRNFWMGFYNLCLGLTLFWLISGYCVRRRKTLPLPGAVVLMFLFATAYFTHLIAFLLAFAGAVGAVALAPPRRWLGPVLVGLAALPSACLVVDYFDRTGFFKAGVSRRFIDQPLAMLGGTAKGTNFVKEIERIDRDLFEHHAGTQIPFSVLLLPFYGLMAAFTLVGDRRWSREGRESPGWLFPALFGFLLLAVYLLTPDDAGGDHGAYIKTRLAPLLWLACLREPEGPRMRLVLRAVAVLLLSVNLVLATWTVQAGNRKLKQYTRGGAAVGRGHRLFVVQPNVSPPPLVNPLLHASHYYCLGTDNINLDNYEASTPHFPIRYRRGVERGKGDWRSYANQAAVDTILIWEPSPEARSPGPAGWDEIFTAGQLRIYRRPADQ